MAIIVRLRTTPTPGLSSPIRPQSREVRFFAHLREVMPSKQFFRFSYYVPRKKGRPSLPHQLRDGDAALELSEVLRTQGYEYGEVLLNYPAQQEAQAIEIDDTFLSPADLLLLTTRPPLDDEDEPLRKTVHRSHTTLEDKVFAALRPYFKRCNRSQIILSESLVRTLPPEVARKSNIQYRQHGGASYDRYTAGPGDDWHKRPSHLRLTAAYLAYTEHAWEGGPALLAAFAMGGTETLVWAHLLRTKFSYLVCTTPFVMAEMTAKEPPTRSTDLSFADEWNVEILTEQCNASPGSVSRGNLRTKR